MSRTTVQTKRATQALEDEETVEDDLDEATAPTGTEPVICQQYVVYSATFQVPTFYFTMHSSRPCTLIIDRYTYFNAREQKEIHYRWMTFFARPFSGYLISGEWRTLGLR